MRRTIRHAGPHQGRNRPLVELQRLWAVGLSEEPIVPVPVFCWDGSSPVNGQCPECWDGTRALPGQPCPPNPGDTGGIPWWVWVALLGLGGLVVVAGSSNKDDKYRPKYETTTRRY